MTLENYLPTAVSRLILQRQGPARYAPLGAIGVDLNCDSLAETKIQMADGAPLVLEQQKRVFDPGWSREEKETWIYAQID